MKQSDTRLFRSVDHVCSRACGEARTYEAPAMPISGLVITLTEDVGARESALAAMAGHAAISVGQPTGLRVPIVVETPDSDADRDVWEWLQTLPGIALVTVAVVHFTPTESPATSSCTAHPTPDA